ncbi:MAG: class I SAM-dependent methyltransferase [Candidatus Scalindua sp.]
MDLNFKDTLKRTILEYKYFTLKNWSIKEVGEYWDSVTDYDDINEVTYSYYKRFTNTWDLAKDFVNNDMYMLDIQARTGKGTEFWFGKGVIKKSYLVDFSDYLLSIAKARLKGSGYDYELIKVIDYKLPFDDAFFDFVVTYETVEHMGNVNTFVKELTRVLKAGGIMILTCPNVFWEPFHWIAAIFNIHHSEGPHRFLKRKKLLQLFEANRLTIIKENTTVILPFNKNISIKISEKLEKTLHQDIVRLIGLRRSYVLRKS